MQAIHAHISTKQEEIAKHPFLTGLQPERELERALWFAPHTAFWAMGFQDVLRLNAATVEDPELRRIVHRHQREDAGHDRWYLEDLAAIGRRNVDLAWLFGEECRATREATFAIAAECARAENDVLRLVLVLALEGAGHVMFGKVTTVLRDAGHQDRLRYFASSHLDVELAHDVFATEVQRYIDAIALSDSQRVAAFALIDRVFAAFTLMADGFVRVREAALKRGERTT